MLRMLDERDRRELQKNIDDNAENLSDISKTVEEKNKELVQQIDNNANELNAAIGNVETSLTSQIDLTKTNLQTNINQVAQGLQDQLEDVMTAIGDVETSLTSKIDLTKTNLQTNINQVTQDLQDQLEDAMEGTNPYTDEEKTKLANIEDGANNYTLPVATASTLGGIVSGGDITIDGSGHASINDDSHNHVINNIDGLQLALNDRAMMGDVVLLQNLVGNTAVSTQISDAIQAAIGNLTTDINKRSIDMFAPVHYFENGYYGVRAAKCAATYLWERVNGNEHFAYQTDSIFSTVNKNGQANVRITAEDTETKETHNYARIDCSTFVGLCLRNIPYNKSPYYVHNDKNTTNEKWTPSAELPAMYGTEGWEFRELDAQPEGIFNNIGIAGYSTARLAADFGQYFHRYGHVLYDSAIDGKLASNNESHTKLKLQPGDLVFWDTSEDPVVDARYKAISHVAIVAEKTDYYYHVTGSKTKFGQIVVWYEQFAETDTKHPNSALVLAVRPDYRHGKPKEATPVGVNLVGYPWVYSRLVTSEKNGLTISLASPNEIKLNGTPTASTTLSLNYIKLSPGEYELTGLEGFTGVDFTLQVRNADGTDLTSKVRYPVTSGTVNKFTLTEETEVNVRLYIASGQALTDASVTPTLIRLS